MTASKFRKMRADLLALQNDLDRHFAEVERLQAALEQICLGDADDWSVIIARRALDIPK
jgi:hypothetical protein